MIENSIFIFQSKFKFKKLLQNFTLLIQLFNIMQNNDLSKYQQKMLDCK